ncbi:hypothetical protein ACIQCG_00700 [Streptomyces noursei]|uniref:hypothetical protein n=1 Tax=Streptomyces noursei TaxID=1971 RepID=UPI0037F5AA74
MASNTTESAGKRTADELLALADDAAQRADDALKSLHGHIAATGAGWATLAGFYLQRRRIQLDAECPTCRGRLTVSRWCDKSSCKGWGYGGQQHSHSEPCPSLTHRL